LAIALRYAARSDVGLVRSNNQDSAYAGPHLLVVADGMGGHAGGDVASSLAIGELAPLDDESHGADALDHLSAAVQSAHQELLDRVDSEPALAGMGTTVTALLRTGNRLALAHIGDSRAYLMREGALVQITKDHTFVQTLVDEGRISAQDAEHHPQRSVLMRVLSDMVDVVEPDLSMREARIGDRYLLCSDGLSGVVSTQTLQDALAEPVPPAQICEKLVQLALRAGAPDNVTCIVADVIADSDLGDSASFVVGAASMHKPRRGLRSSRASAAERAAALTAAGDGDEEDSHAQPAIRAGWKMAAAAALAVVLVIGGGFGAWRWVQDQMFVGDEDGAVAIFSGLPQDVGPVRLSRLREAADDVRVTDLPDYAADQVRKGIPADTDAQAHDIVARFRSLAERCRATPSPSGSPSPSSASPSGSASGSPAVSATGSPSIATARTGSTPGAAPRVSLPPASPTGAPSPSGPTASSPTPSGSAPGSVSGSPSGPIPAELDCGDGA
jgi:serine/threonine protein phosphatase PrpC